MSLFPPHRVPPARCQLVRVAHPGPFRVVLYIGSGDLKLDDSEHSCYCQLGRLWLLAKYLTCLWCGSCLTDEPLLC